MKKVSSVSRRKRRRKRRETEESFLGAPQTLDGVWNVCEARCFPRTGAGGDREARHARVPFFRKGLTAPIRWRPTIAGVCKSLAYGGAPVRGHRRPKVRKATNRQHGFVNATRQSRVTFEDLRLGAEGREITFSIPGARVAGLDSNSANGGRQESRSSRAAHPPHSRGIRSG